MCTVLQFSPIGEHTPWFLNQLRQNVRVQSDDHQNAYFARSNHRHPFRKVGIKPLDRLAHMYVVGKTGTGKTTLIENLLMHDITAGGGCVLIDPHGDLVKRVAAHIPAHREHQTHYVNIADANTSYGYNPLHSVSEPLRPLVASGLLDVFKKMWSDAWGTRMEHVLRNTIYALLDQETSSLPDILHMLTDKTFRAQALRNIQNEQVKLFWRQEFPKYSSRYQADGIAPIQNKVGAFLADPRLYRFFTRTDGLLRLRRIMDSEHILLVNLAKGTLGADSSSLLGGLLVTSLGLAAYSRANTAETARRPFYIYVDEFQNFATLAFAELLSELRKFGIGAILVNQYLSQIDSDVRHAVLGNAGTLISFRLGSEDARALAHEFEPHFDSIDLMNLANHDIILKLMIDGNPSQPFSATTLPPQSNGSPSVH